MGSQGYVLNFVFNALILVFSIAILRYSGGALHRFA